MLAGLLAALPLAAPARASGIPPPPVPHTPAQAAVTLLADPVEVAPGGTTILSWHAANATSCTASGGWSEPKPLSGSYATPPLRADTSFFLTCTNGTYSVTRSKRVTVTPPPRRPNPLDGMAPGTWYEVPNSKMTAVCAPNPNYSVFGDCRYIDYSGGAFDTKRDRYVIWGGGHKGYGGNEVYAFDIAGLKWLRLSEPSVLIYNGDGTHPTPGNRPDGSAWFPGNEPNAAHTYDALVYVPTVDKLFVPGTARLLPWDTNGKPKMYLRRFRNGDTAYARFFDLATRQWGPPMGGGKPYPHGPKPVSAAFDPRTNAVYTGEYDGGFTRFDVATKTWRGLGVIRHKIVGAYPFHNAVTFDTRRGRYVAIGAGRVWTYSPTEGFRVRNPTGDLDILSVFPPGGFAYDAKDDRLVAWAGGADIYAIDPESWTVRRRAPSAANRVAPAAQRHRSGVYGRFQYVASKGVFLLNNDSRQDVFFYKPDFRR